MNNMLLLGSCRYQNIFKEQQAQAFPPRLHSTKELLYFLQHIKDFDHFSYEHLNLLFGDCLHEMVRPDFELFMDNRNTVLSGLRTLVLEITSRKVCFDGERPLNVNYTISYEQHFQITHLSDEEIYSDLSAIQSVAKKELGIERIIIITHVSLPRRETGAAIEERARLIDLLNELAYFLNIEIINISNAFSGCFLEDIMPDGYHYTETGEMAVRHFLKDRIFH